MLELQAQRETGVEHQVTVLRVFRETSFYASRLEYLNNLSNL